MAWPNLVMFMATLPSYEEDSDGEDDRSEETATPQSLEDFNKLIFGE